MNHRPRKRFGQNFLQSKPIIDRIISSFDLHADDNVLEIGPGMGALTFPMLRSIKHLTAIEIDRDLHALLMDSPQAAALNVIAADALTLDYREFGNALRVVGNLPYNISTPLMLHLLSFTEHIKDMHFMLQKEVVNRLSGQPGTKAYGRLSVMVQYHCEVLPLFEVPPEAFHPRPKVDSAIVRLIPHGEARYPAVNRDNLQKVVATAFSMRRKTLANNLKPLFSVDKLQALNIDPGLRPEQISVLDYVRLANNMQVCV